jgi:hypothetical protein
MKVKIKVLRMKRFTVPTTGTARLKTTTLLGIRVSANSDLIVLLSGYSPHRHRTILLRHATHETRVQGEPKLTGGLLTG